MSERRVLRYEIPVDDERHEIGAGRALMAHPWRKATTEIAGRVELLVEAETPATWPSGRMEARPVQVFGTGQPIPEGAVWLGSCLDGHLVWHVYDLSDVEEEE